MSGQRKKARRLIAILLWLMFLIYLNIYPPNSILLVGGFYLLILISVFWTLSLFFEKPGSISYTLLIFITLLLRQFRLLNIFNFLLIIAVAVSLELYFRKK